MYKLYADLGIGYKIVSKENNINNIIKLIDEMIEEFNPDKILVIEHTDCDNIILFYNGNVEDIYNFKNKYQERRKVIK